MTPARTRYPVQDEWIETWVAMRSLEKPLSLRRIAAWYEVSPAIVHRYTKEHVRSTVLRGGPRKFNREQAKLLDARGWTRTRIAAYLGVSTAAITKALGPKQRKRRAA